MSRLFALAAVLAIAGALLALAGTQTAWERGTIAGREVLTDEGSFPFPDETRSFDGNDLAPRATGGAVLLLVLSALPVLLGPRARPLLYAFAVVVAGFVLWSATRAAEPDFAGATRPAPGRVLTITGAGLALAASAVAIGPSSGVPRLAMPERAPE